MKHVDGQRQHLGFGQGSRCSDEFHTVLEEFSVAPGFELLVAVALTVVGQAQRFGVHAHFFGDHAHDGRRQFGTQRQVSFALVLKGVELVDDARSRFGGEQFEGFEYRRLDTRKTVALRHILEQVLERQSSPHRRRREVPSPTRSLHHCSKRAVAASRPLRS